ncbi:MAG: DUF86 domain-containing protein [Saprospiraceae bacterium]|nr:DUF86 domain-containing protein [Saprospiraceae bacterium]
MGKSDLVYLKHIRNAITQILSYTHSLSEKDFYSDQMVKDAVVRNFEIIGEATKQISESTRQAYPSIEWRKMAGMRDKLIHDYIDVDYFIVWHTISDVLPTLESEILEIIKINEA